jgi:hypothetical protein
MEALDRARPAAFGLSGGSNVFSLFNVHLEKDPPILVCPKDEVPDVMPCMSLGEVHED